MNDIDRAEYPKPSILSIENTAWLAIGLLAAGLRFFQLGLKPLSEAEAVQALAAHEFVRGTSWAAPAGTIPTLFTGNVIGFSALGASDWSARWLPALVGLILVLLPYGLRHRLGRGGALAAAGLLAISPSVVFFSRTLDSAVLVAACGLAVAVGLINYVDTRRPAALYLAAVALGLGLTAGTGSLTLLVIFAAFAAILYAGEKLLARQTGWSALDVAWSTLRSESRLLTRSGVALAAAFALAATTLVLQPAGIGHAADLVTAWARGFFPDPASQPFFYPLVLSLRYEPLILTLGLFEAGWAVLKRRADPDWMTEPVSSFPHSAFLAFWAVAAALVIVLSGHRPAGNVLLVLVPLALLAGQGIERAGRWVMERELWPKAALFAIVALGLLVFFYLQIAFYSQASATDAVKIADMTLFTSSTHLILALVALLLLVALAIATWLWLGPEAMLAGSWLAIVVALSLYGFKAMSELNFTRAGDPRELMVLQATAPEIRDMAAQLKSLSADESGDPHTLAITRDRAAGPVVAWYLREFVDQTVVESLSDPPDTVAAVGLAAENPPIGETYRGRGYPLRSHWQPRGLRGQSLVKWLLFNAGQEPTVDRTVVLWVTNQP